MDGTEIAIIGMAGRFPRARNIAQYWQNLRDGIECITFFTDQELQQLGVARSDLSATNYVKAAAAMPDVDLFDAAFFGINPREAELMDPQHRIFLECAWEALEAAAYDPGRYTGSIGVYAGCEGINTYLLFHLLTHPEIVNSIDYLQTAIGNAADFLTTRVSYKLNLKGPSHIVQSACSTSLVAVHIACQSLLHGECDMALAGGVSFSVQHRRGYRHLPGGITSADGHCRAFDAKAQGTIFGTGTGVVVLKKLDEALADGDRVHAIIKGSALNNDGALKVGYTAPSVEGQAEVVTEALAIAGVEAESISYIETHGTGTQLGDPVEVQALTRAFRAGTNRAGFCALGSVKTNIGHLSAAAGVAGLIKTVLALQHKQLPPSLNFETPNPAIDFANSPFYVNATLAEWPASEGPRRAGVSSFGVGGTNAHVILEEAPAGEASGPSRPWQLLVLSAKTPAALEAATAKLGDYLSTEAAAKLADVAYTLQIGRSAFSERRVLVCRDPQEAQSLLEARDPQRVFTASVDGHPHPLTFMFPGQGSQSVRMAAELYQTEPVFRAEVERCAVLLAPHLGLDLRTVLYPGEGSGEQAAALHQTALAQPALFVIEYALAKLWMDWGLTPQSMIGHSLGEYVAACLAGVFSLADALMLVAARGRMMQSLSSGAMLAVALPELEMRPLLETSLCLAAVNSASLCVVSGPVAAVDELEQSLKQKGIVSRRLQTSHAFHSAMMDAILEPFAELVRRVTLKPPQIPYVSNVTGMWISDAEATDPAYWVRHLRQTVRFADGLSRLFEQPGRSLLEVGPGQTLMRLVQGARNSSAAIVLSSLPPQTGRQSEVAHVLTTLGKLWATGTLIDWSRFYAAEHRQRLTLPTYAFERQRYWIEPQQQATAAASDGVSETLAAGRNGDRLEAVSEPVTRRQGEIISSLHPRPALGTQWIAPRTEIEQTIATIWQQGLGIELIGIHDDFFELGGDSLLATQLIARVGNTFQIELPLRDLFASPTVAGLARQVEMARRADPGPTGQPLPPVARTGRLALSFTQQRLWFLDQLEPGSPLYNIPAAVRLSGPLNVTALERSLNEIVRRHEVLRTTFPILDGRPVQRIAPSLRLTLEWTDLTGAPVAASESAIQERLAEAARQPFDLAQGPLLRVSLLRLRPDEQIVFLSVHHIVFDGWSLGIFIRELADLYTAFCADSGSPLPELPLQVVDFAHWQRQWLQGEVRQAQLDYWLKQLGDNRAVLQLPTDRPRPAVQTYRGARHYVSLTSGLAEALKRLCQSAGATSFMALLAAFQTLLQRYTGQDDITVGSPIANRRRPETEALIGFFANTLVLRSDLSGNPTFRELLGRVRETALAAYAHQDLPFEQLVEALQPQRDISVNPLFQVMFILQNGAPPPVQLPGLSLSLLKVDTGTAKFDLTLELTENADGISGYFEYNRDLFDAETMGRMAGHFQGLLEQVASDPDRRLADLILLTDDERQQILVEWNDRRAAYPQHLGLHELFEAQTERTPEAPALICESQQLTYSELNRRANQLARQLLALGLRREELVGVCMERSLEMVVALLGILKAGGAYVPLDPAYPQERLTFMLEDARIGILLIQEPLSGLLAKPNLQVICLDASGESLAGMSEEPCDRQVVADGLAYVIYTSGSTGKPKGVQITHRAVVNFLNSMRRQPGLSAGDRLLAVTSLSFDIAGLELFLPIVVGACSIIAHREVAADGRQLLELLNRSGATVMQATPATWRLLLESGWQGSRQFRILCGGEALPGQLASQLRQRGAALWNLYGPTETTIWSSACEIQSDGPVRIGRPIDNTEIYLLDPRQQPVPVGVAGELHIGGAGLARGYLNRPELTAEKFIPDPFSQTPGARLYKTGDLARYHLNGQIECLGRIDQQVKHRGFRIELGEIETVLANHSGVQECVVVARDDEYSQKRLIAYLIATPSAPPTVSDLRACLKQALPEYMLPSAFVMLDAWPLTPNGKLDRRALPAPDFARPRLRDAFVPADTPVERALAEIWSAVLGTEKVGIHDNFFELGGDSILGITMVIKAQQAGFAIVAKELFQNQTIALLASLVTSKAMPIEAASLIEAEPSPDLAQPFAQAPHDRPSPAYQPADFAAFNWSQADLHDISDAISKSLATE